MNSSTHTTTRSAGVRRRSLALALAVTTATGMVAGSGTAHAGFSAVTTGSGTNMSCVVKGDSAYDSARTNWQKAVTNAHRELVVAIANDAPEGSSAYRELHPYRQAADAGTLSPQDKQKVAALEQQLINDLVSVGYTREEALMLTTGDTGVNNKLYDRQVEFTKKISAATKARNWRDSAPTLAAAQDEFAHFLAHPYSDIYSITSAKARAHVDAAERSIAAAAADYAREGSYAARAEAMIKCQDLTDAASGRTSTRPTVTSTHHLNPTTAAPKPTAAPEPTKAPTTKPTPTAKPTQPTPTQAKPTATQAKPTQVKPTEKPAQPKPTATQAKPTQAKPTEQPAQPKPSATQAKPTQAKPTATQAKPTEAKPSQVKPTQAKPTATQAKPSTTPAKPSETKTSEMQTSEKPTTPPSNGSQGGVIAVILALLAGLGALGAFLAQSGLVILPL
ncbi:hypothetical protein C1Y63_01110 [Corynebacterium sp. 13CS0277]|uniref:hypothetical protein n=1 Tax=Corynebacterium sp. 13CS0277 TaxID=2071994 RepID=UPI000D0304D5|nr:hypothetical protein [Corynebacterium sp. 13CS0277]PRQ12420.1 hypothetical protein C1Y63_01110 [Corynebacterium sp. 13CS0277]